jgi:hypothetical protein
MNDLISSDVERVSGTRLRRTRGLVTFVSLALGTFALAGCSGQSDGPTMASPVSWETFRAAATRTVEGRTIYVVEGDLPVGEEELRLRYDRYVAYLRNDGENVARIDQKLAVNQVNGADDVWIPFVQQNLSYCVTNDFGGNKARAVSEMALATAAWEREINVNFTYLPSHDANCSNSNTLVTFSVRPSTSGGACAFFPTIVDSPPSYCVSRTLVMDFNDFDTNPYWATNAPNLRTEGVFRHELGHILGMRHEHTRPESGTCFENNNWRALTPYDKPSVMHYPYCNGVHTSDETITPLDALGAGRIYGKHRAPIVGAAAGYVRPDGVSAVLYPDGSSHIKELALVGTSWSKGDLTAITGAPSAISKPSAFVRFAERAPDVAYIGADNHIWDLALNGGWSKSDLSALTGAPAPAGSSTVAAYTRSDGVSSVVYRSGSNIHELYRVPFGSGWGVGNLSAIAGAPAAADDPRPYVRADRINIVLYRSTDDHIRELALVGGTWIVSDLTAVTGAPTARGTAVGYVRSDGVTAVVFRGTDDHVWELRLVGGWIKQDITATTGAAATQSEPYPYVRGDRVNSLVYRGFNSHMYELALSNGSWSAWDLTAFTGAPNSLDSPTGYLRADGASSVTFRSSADLHVYELKFSGGTWTAVDLSALVGGP